MPLASLLQQAKFEPDTTQILTAAFDQAWAQLQASGSPLADKASAESTRTLLAKRIIETGQRGERDVGRLVEDALGYLANQR